MQKLYLIIISAVLVNNFILTKFLGICPFIGVSSQIDASLGMGAAVIFVMTMASAVTWLIQTYLLNPFGLGFLQRAWVSDPNIAIFSVSFALVWQFSGYVMLIFLAAIRSIPQSHVMAAQIDGASGFKLYIRVIIPQIKTSTFTAFVILMIFALKAFDFIWILTDEGGPGWATTILPIMIYRVAFRANQFAYSAAIATTLLLIVMLIVIPYLYITYRKRK